MSKTVKTILIVVLCLAILGGIAGVVAWTQSDKFDQKDLSYVGKYEVGGLDSNGSYMSTNASIYTKKPIECQGLNCNLVFDTTISYQLYFYDQNNEFVNTTGRLTGTFGEDGVPFFAKYVRIVITPNDDDKVTSLEVGKYAKQLKVSVNREQGFKNYTENLLEVDKTLTTLTTSGVETSSETPGSCVSKYINISSYKDSLIFRSHSQLSDEGYAYFYNAEKSFVGRINFHDWAKVTFKSSEGVVYYDCVFSDLPFDGVCFLRFAYNTNSPFEIHCR